MEIKNINLGGQRAESMIGGLGFEEK